MNGWDWNAIYLTCFGVGLVLSFVAFFAGGMHLHVGHFHFGGHGLKAHAKGGGVSPLNGFTLVAFLCWFGGAGYLLHRGNVFDLGLVLLFAVLSGIAGAALVFWFLAFVLMPGERTLESSDTEMTGAIGTLNCAVPRHGVGELLYSQNGARRSASVRSDDGEAIERGAEVVVMRYVRGIAYVKRWDEFEHGLMADGPGRAKDLEREGKG
jgi:membrane protein implicated in regulation of membrane protease activity